MRKSRGISTNWSWKPPYGPDSAVSWPKFRNGKRKKAKQLQNENYRLRQALKNAKKGDRRARKPHPFYDSERWKALRFDVLKRDGGKCVLCGRTAHQGAILHVDHIVPRSRAPELEWEPANLQVLCQDCNLGKSNRDITDFRA